MRSFEVATHSFASSALEDLWLLRGEKATLEEKRSDRGFALTSLDASGFHITGSDSERHCPWLPRSLASDLDAAAEQLEAERQRLVTDAIECLRGFELQEEVRLRVRSSVRATSSEGGSHTAGSIMVAVAGRFGHGALSIVASSRSMNSELDLLREALRADEPLTQPHGDEPLVFTNGSGGVLLHEAIGHASQSRPVAADCPSWLEVYDDPAFPSLGESPIDDCGLPATTELLSGSGSPRSWRRESFRDAPLRRMTNLVVRCAEESASLPLRRIEILLVSGGHYDAATDRVSLVISRADLVDGNERAPLRPFTLDEDRKHILRALRGTRGATAKYPGVICFDEGQRLPVGTASPDLLVDSLWR
ncbi:MAG: hypothetical protein ABI718_12450 [Acidobacteriota bacterium]